MTECQERLRQCSSGSVVVCADAEGGGAARRGAEAFILLLSFTFCFTTFFAYFALVLPQTQAGAARLAELLLRLYALAIVPLTIWVRIA